MERKLLEKGITLYNDIINKEKEISYLKNMRRSIENHSAKAVLTVYPYSGSEIYLDEKTINDILDKKEKDLVREKFKLEIELDSLN